MENPHLMGAFCKLRNSIYKVQSTLTNEIWSSLKHGKCFLKKIPKKIQKKVFFVIMYKFSPIREGRTASLMLCQEVSH